MKKRDIVISSTNKGFLSMHFWSVVWSMLLLYIAKWASVYMGQQQYSGQDFFPWPYALVYGSYVAVSIIVVCNLHSAIYSAREFMTLSHNEEGFLEKIVNTMYGFPFSIEILQTSFNRIVDIEVNQSSLDRILNTGDLCLKLVTFTNAEALEKSYTITAIKSPFEIKRMIEESIPGHEGLMIKK